MGRYTRHSKFLSYVLRHEPAELGLELDSGGWAPVRDLLEAAAKRDDTWSLELLTAVVETNPKQRFELSPGGQWIRARQGHADRRPRDGRRRPPVHANGQRRLAGRLRTARVHRAPRRPHVVLAARTLLAVPTPTTIRR